MATVLLVGCMWRPSSPKQNEGICVVGGGGGGGHLQDCIGSELLLPDVELEAMLLAVGKHLVMLKHLTHEHVHQPVKASAKKPALVLPHAALQGSMVAFDGSIGILVGMVNVSECHHPVGCIHTAINVCQINELEPSTMKWQLEQLHRN